MWNHVKVITGEEGTIDVMAVCFEHTIVCYLQMRRYRIALEAVSHKLRKMLSRTEH